MQTLNDLAEKEFEKLIESEAYDDVQGILFKLARSAFIAGYEASKKEYKHNSTIIISPPKTNN